MKQLFTNRFYLNKVSVDDAEDMLDLRSDPVVLKYIGREPLKSIEEAKDYIQENLQKIEDGKLWLWAIRDRTAIHELMGSIALFKIDETHHRCSVGYSLRTKFHRKGVLSECLPVVLDFAFQEAKLHSIQAEIDPENIASEKLLLKMGFKKEGYFTENFCFRGEYLDAAIFSLLEKWRK